MKWAKILSKNSESKKINIFSDFELEFKSFKNLWDYFYTFLMNSNPNAIHITYNDVFNVESAYYFHFDDEKLLYDHNSVQIPNSIQIKKVTSEPEALIGELRKWTKAKFSFEINNIRIFSMDFIKKYNEIIQSKQQNHHSSVITIGKILDLIVQDLENTTLLLYPQPKIITLFEGISEYLINFSFKELFEIIDYYSPSFTILLTLKSAELLNSFQLQKKNRKSLVIKGIKNQKMDFSHEQNTDISSIQETFLPEFKDYLHSLKVNPLKHLNIIVDIERFIDLIQDVLNISFPITEIEEFYYLLNQILLFYRNFEKYWWSYPKPLKYNDRLRFWLYSLSFKMNYKKISHWAIPRIFLNLHSLFNPKSKKILLFVGSSLKKLSYELIETKAYCILINFQNNLITSVEMIKEIEFIELIKQVENELKMNKKKKHSDYYHPNFLRLVREQFYSKYHSLPQVLWISHDLIKIFCKEFIHSFKSFQLPLQSIGKIIKYIQKDKHLLSFPQNLLINYIKSHRRYMLLRKIALILTEQQEF